MESVGWGITVLSEDDFVCDKCQKEIKARFVAERDDYAVEGIHVEKLGKDHKEVLKEKYLCLLCVGKLIKKQYHFDGGGSYSYCERCGGVLRHIGGTNFCESCDDEDSENEW